MGMSPTVMTLSSRCTLKNTLSQPYVFLNLAFCAQAQTAHYEADRQLSTAPQGHRSPSGPSGRPAPRRRARTWCWSPFANWSAVTAVFFSVRAPEAAHSGEQAQSFHSSPSVGSTKVRGPPGRSAQKAPSQTRAGRAASRRFPPSITSAVKRPENTFPGRTAQRRNTCAKNDVRLDFCTRRATVRHAARAQAAVRSGLRNERFRAARGLYARLAAPPRDVRVSYR